MTTEVLVAEGLFEAGQFEEALVAWRDVAAGDSASVRARGRIGACLVALGRFADAVEDLAALAREMPDQPLIQYRLAVARAGMDDDDGALSALDAAAGAGLRAASGVDDEPAFRPLRDRARYVAIREQIGNNDHPTADDPRFRGLDFWVGTWEARTADGVLQGHNRIEIVLGGAAIVERWTGATGFTGMSLNRYDTATDRWRQTWVDDQGDVVEFVDGHLEDGRLTFVAEDADGGRRRLTFTDEGPDALRQHSERSADGTAWSTEYDFHYRRLPADVEGVTARSR